MSALSALAEKPGRVENLFLSKVNQLSRNGIYGVTLWTLGVPHTIIVDDYLPIKYEDGKYKTMFAQMGDDSSVWVPIMEKSISKNFGNYHHIENNFPIEAIRLLTGAPSITLMH